PEPPCGASPAIPATFCSCRSRAGGSSPGGTAWSAASSTARVGARRSRRPPARAASRWIRTSPAEVERVRIERRRYAELYGPTTGDRFRLADTNLVCEVERDLTVPGDEAVVGGGKTIRDGMAQSAGLT